MHIYRHLRRVDVLRIFFKNIRLFIKTCFDVLGVIFFIFLILFLYNRHMIYGQCVHLPNGLIIAHEAYFNLSSMIFMPTFVVKGPDDTILSRGFSWEFNFSITTAYWTVRPSRNISEEHFAYRPDVGLVRSLEKPNLYKKLILNAGKLLEEDRSTSGIWSWLRTDPNYTSRDCDVPFITFKGY